MRLGLLHHLRSAMGDRLVRGYSHDLFHRICCHVLAAHCAQVCIQRGSARARYQQWLHSVSQRAFQELRQKISANQIRDDVDRQRRPRKLHNNSWRIFFPYLFYFGSLYEVGYYVSHGDCAFNYRGAISVTCSFIIVWTNQSRPRLLLSSQSQRPPRVCSGNSKFATRDRLTQALLLVKAKMSTREECLFEFDPHAHNVARGRFLDNCYA
mmetsp:Transcript_98612/g.155419  ORF Transcript_98612/g.155419 Transcript_98612/m.155419 type:complete len:210 (+) Transcript_98612:968-1597(+)